MSPNDLRVLIDQAEHTYIYNQVIQSSIEYKMDPIVKTVLLKLIDMVEKLQNE